MELNPPPVPVKSKYMNPKLTSKPSDLNPKSKPREKRVFGTARNPNVPNKTANPAKAALKKAEKQPSQPLRTSSPDKNQTRPKKKSVCFQENEVVRSDDNNPEPQTPLKLADTAAKPRRVSTPYHTADKCSKCRFDKLETSAYWVGQIKLAESVGKHSVSAAFFKLALDCKAEPIRNVRVELKKYVARHEHLSDEQQWKRLWVMYGFAKEVNEGNEDNEGNEIYQE